MHQYIFPEPVGSVAPKVNKNDEFSHDRVSENHTVALKCPAQSYPVPIYRCVETFPKREKF